MHGTGKYFYQNGDLYDGEWFRNFFHGKGTYYQHSSGMTFRGEFEHGKAAKYDTEFSLINKDGQFLDEMEKFKQPLYEKLK
jgi:hypothetical protein